MVDCRTLQRRSRRRRGHLARTAAGLLVATTALTGCASWRAATEPRPVTAEDLTWGSWRLARLEWVFPLHWTRTRLRFLEAGRFEGFGGMAEFSGSYQLGPDGQLTFERLDSELTPLNVNVAVPTSLYEPSLDNQVGSRFGGTPIAQQERLEVLLSRVDRGELRGPRLLLFERDQVILEFSPLEPQPRPSEDSHANSEAIPTKGDSASGN